MRYSKYIISAVVILLLFSASAFAQSPVVFPAQGQSVEQQKQDEYDCYQWAKQYTGFDPASTPPPQASAAPAPQQKSNSPGALGGALIGGAGGAGVGALTAPRHKAGKRAVKGALIGAGAGAILGHMHKEKQESQQYVDQQPTQQQVTDYNTQRDSFNRAYGACLEGKGYTVK